MSAGASAAYLALKATCFSQKLFHLTCFSPAVICDSAGLAAMGVFMQFLAISLAVFSGLLGADTKKQRQKCYQLPPFCLSVMFLPLLSL